MPARISIPIHTQVTDKYDRAAPRGTGAVKAGGNYAHDMLPLKVCNFMCLDMCGGMCGGMAASLQPAKMGLVMSLRYKVMAYIVMAYIVMASLQLAKDAGFGTTLYTDAKEHRYIDQALGPCMRM